MSNEDRGMDRVTTGREHLRILIVDDHGGTQRALWLMLRWLGCRPEVADDGRAAVEATRAVDYDVILMDVMMPRMDGLEATRRIRQERASRPGLRIVGMSADSSPEDREIGLGAGMDDFLPKPIDVASLARILDEVVTGSVSVR